MWQLINVAAFVIAKNPAHDLGDIGASPPVSVNEVAATA
jgi:hypothetical protein